MYQLKVAGLPVIHKVVKPIGEWKSLRMLTQSQNHRNLLLDKWSAFDREMRIERANKEMALK